MSRVQNPNLEIVELAVVQLGELVDEMVFLGGCATGLLISDQAAPPTRMTRDVDTLVQVASLAEYHQLSRRLYTKGFKEDTSDGAPLCRWTSGLVVLDVMPTDSSILGFGNRWYAPAIAHAVMQPLPSGRAIRMVSGPYFLLTKLEAFDGRGHGDYLMSHDMEDIVAVLDGRLEIVDEVLVAGQDVVGELAKRFDGLIKDRRFLDALYGHMPSDSVSQARVALIRDKLQKIARYGGG